MMLYTLEAHEGISSLGRIRQAEGIRDDAGGVLGLMGRVSAYLLDSLASGEIAHPCPVALIAVMRGSPDDRVKRILPIGKFC